MLIIQEISSIDIHAFKCLFRMPSENSNPWSGELKAKRQKSKGKSDPRSPPVRVPISEPFLPKSPAKDLGQPVTIKSNELDGKIEENYEITQTNNQPVEHVREGKVDESTESMLKNTRRNLKPVSQPFKRSESTNKDDQEESPVERLIRQGSLDCSQDLPYSNLNGGLDVSPGMQGMQSTSNGEGNRCKLFFQCHHQRKYLLRTFES